MWHVSKTPFGEIVLLLFLRVRNAGKDPLQGRTART